MQGISEKMEKRSVGIVRKLDDVVITPPPMSEILCTDASLPAIRNVVIY